MIKLCSLSNDVVNINNLDVNVEGFNTFYGKYCFCHDKNTYYLKVCKESEIFNEMFAAKFADKMGIKHADYDICRYNGNLCSLSTAVYKNDEDFIPLVDVASNIISNYGSANTLQSMKRKVLPSLCFFSQIEEFNKYLDIFMFDILLGNNDRHENNIGFIKKGNNYSIAPIFDNGSIGNDKAIWDHAYSQGLDNRKYDPNNITDTIVEIFKNKKYGKVLASYLDKYSMKDFEEIVKIVNNETKYLFDKDYELYLLDQLKINLKILNECKNDFYDSKRLKRG